MGPQARFPVRAQGLGHHGRSQVGTADADVDDIADGPAGEAQVPALVHPADELVHALQHLAHPGHDVAAIDQDGSAVEVAQGHVQHRPLLGEVDLLPRKHAPAPLGDLGLPGQGEQQLHGTFVDQVLGVIEEYVIELQREAPETLWIIREHIGDSPAAHLPAVGRQLLPGGKLGGCRHENTSRVVGLPPRYTAPPGGG